MMRRYLLAAGLSFMLAAPVLGAGPDGVVRGTDARPPYLRQVLEIIYCLAPDGAVNQISAHYTLGCRSGTLPPGSRQIGESRAQTLIEEERIRSLVDEQLQKKQTPTTKPVPVATTVSPAERWRGNVRCDDRLRSRFEVTLTDGRFSHTGYNLTISGTITGGKYAIQGRYRDDEFSVNGTFSGDAINAADESLFTSCYVNMFRESTPTEQQATGAVIATSEEIAKKRDEEITRLKAEYQRMVREEEAAKVKSSGLVGVVTSPSTLGVDAAVTPPAVKAAQAEIARLRKKLEELQLAQAASRASGAVAARKAGPGAGLKGIDFGKYHALVIGIDAYKHLPKLKTAVHDAKAVSGILKADYGFKVKTLINPTRGDILDALDIYRETLGPTDNLLIYYAGHGWLDDEVDRGYWLPVNAKPKRRRGWVSNATVTDTLKGLNAKHVMVVADSCYSGTLVRSAAVGSRSRIGEYWKEMAKKWARVAITSGGLEPVADKGGGQHSPFAKAFIGALEKNRTIMDGTELFQTLRRPVMVAADQTPEYSDVRGAGHDGGDFLFVRKK